MTAQLIDERYKVKGSVLSNFKQYISKRIGVDFFQEIYKKSGLGMTGMVLTSSWYPIDKYHIMQSLAAEKMGIPLLDFNKEFAREWLENDMNGIYRFFMRVGKPQKVMARMAQIDKGYVNYSELKILKNEPGIWIGTILAPSSIVDWHLSCVEGGMQGVFGVCKVELKGMKIIDQEMEKREGEEMIISTLEITYYVFRIQVNTCNNNHHDCDRSHC